jgi:endonuclease I
VNEARNDRDFDMGGRQHGECRAYRLDADSWEVPDATKGDVARMLFYMDVRYDGTGGESTPDLRLVNTTTTESRRPELALQEGTCDITPFSLLHCRVNSYRLAWRK